MRTLFLLPALLFVASPESLAAPKASAAAYATFKTPAAKGKCLDVVGADPLLTDCDRSPNQQWKVTETDDGGFYKLTTAGGGDRKCLDILNDGKTNNRLRFAACANASGQNWKPTPVAGDYVTLTTQWRGDKMCLDVARDQPVLATCDKTKLSQRWQLELNKARTDAPVAAAPPAEAPAPFEPEFVEAFNKCAYAFPGDKSKPRKHDFVFTCAHAGTKTLQCRYISNGLAYSLRDSDDVFAATVGKDTDAAFNFSSPAAGIEIKTNPRKGDSQLRTKSGSCKGFHLTPEQVRGILAEAQEMVDKEEAAKARARNNDDEESVTFGASDGESSSSSSRPSDRAAKPEVCKKKQSGEKCGLDSECCSKFCKSSNTLRTCK